MKQARLTRRQFFKLSAAGTAALLSLPAAGLATIAAEPSQAALTSARQPQAPTLPQPTFNPIASTTTFGALADISMGWDGTLWGIDAQGAPHIYDALNDTWEQHGDGIDAATLTSDAQTLFIFRDGEVIAVNPATRQAGAAKPIAQQWPSLPDSFKFGVAGAANSPTSEGGLVLFNGGRFISTDGSIPLTALTSLANWPQTAKWKEGVIDGVFSNLADQIFLLRGDEVISIDPLNKQVLAGPGPLSGFLNFAVLPATWAAGVDAIARAASDTRLIFKGGAVYIEKDSGPGSGLSYLGSAFTNWPTTWHPVLQHAPNGRDGNLWSVLPAAHGNWIMQHDGDSWRQVPNQADHVGVGQDNAVMIASAQRLWKFTGALDGSGFTPVSPQSNIVQVSLGSANTVWARDAGNNVYRFDAGSGSLSQNANIGTATHIAANIDGTLWHAKPNDANMHRFLTEANTTQAGIPVKSGIVTRVQKVAATSFGTAHCLTQNNDGSTQLYRYDSPYVFKTATEYKVAASSTSSFAQGLGNLYFVQFIASPMPFQIVERVVAIDAHTGNEVAHYAPASNKNALVGVVFDPKHELVYVATTPANDNDSSSPGELIALDARTLAVKWIFQASPGIDATPALDGTSLCFGARNAVVYCIDTEQAWAAAAQNKPIPARWGFPIDTNGPTSRVSTPLISNGQVIVNHWDVDYDPQDGLSLLSTISIDLNTGTGNNFGLNLPSAVVPKTEINLSLILQPPVMAEIIFPNSTSPARALVVRAADSVLAWNLEASQLDPFAFKLPSGVIASGLTYDDGSRLGGGLSGTGTPASKYRLWFGDDQGNLWSLDHQLRPVDGTPLLVKKNTKILTAPVLYKDTQGGLTVLYGAYDPAFTLTPGLYGYDPDNGNNVSLPTGVTYISTLTASLTSGMVYAGGLPESVSLGNPTQVFGIRVDDLPQAERDFIIESQLMQDPDETATGSGNTDPTNPIPPSKARYQTHLTIVDDQKRPQPKMPVKIWADVANTVISVNGASFTIGPADTAFASVVTDLDGSLVIMSEATDINTSPLRVWASFMDPYERIVIYPDHEWHGRAAQTNAAANANPSRPDPIKPNLNITHNYKGAQLFTNDEKTQGLPANVAKAIGQMNTGLTPGGSSPATVAGTLKTLHGSNPAAPYVAYTTLGGMHYAPSNARVKRTASVAAPIGFRLSKPPGGAHSYSPLSHNDARSAIDGLTGMPWDPNNPNAAFASDAANATLALPTKLVVQRTDNIFTDFWNWLKGFITTIEDVIVSVADDIMVGISFVVNGIKQVFKAIIQVVEDVVNAIGAFFVQLAKLIEDVIEALSVLFHFGEIMWTHRWLRDVINHEVQGLAAALTNNVKGQFDSFVGSAEDTIKGWFDNIRSQFGTSQVNNLKGSGSTLHSTFTVGPGLGPKSSQAVPCSASLQKFKSNAPAAQWNGSAALVAAPSAQDAADPLKANSPDAFPGGDAVAHFFQTFIARLTGDGDLSAAFNQLKTDFGKLFTANSASQFFGSLLATLLDILETLILGAIAIAGALIDGLFGIINGIIQLATSVLNSPIEIPFISWLYKLLFNEDLTILNAVTLVAAIPATIVFRVVEGQYPSAANLPAPTALPNGATTAQRSNRFGLRRTQDIPAAQKIAAKVLGVVNGVFIVIQGVCAALGDAVSESAPKWEAALICGLGTAIAALSVPVLTAEVSSISAWDWASWGVAAGLSLASWMSLGMNDTEAPLFSVTVSLYNCVLLGVVIKAFIADNQTDAQSDINLAANITSLLPGIVNPLKIVAPAAGPIIVAAVDIVAGIIWGAITIEAAFAISTSVERKYIWFFPWIANESANGIENRTAAPFAAGS